eukprot:comp22883_c0_seq1/m.36156 comp22883_c0_seq1/g.36156  ORF comp22883_c0_seq1/g.36156 comp22883_c0_seq1/m.36156 type:complete len:371 (+) comp22883_c0_seq1:1433-2545(+)
MGTHGGQVEGECLCVEGPRVGLHGLGCCPCGLQTLLVKPWVHAACIGVGGHTGQTTLSHRVNSPLQPVQQHAVRREDAGQCAPLGGHVGHRQPVINAQPGNPWAVKLYGMVEHLILVEVSTQRHNHILTRHTGLQLARKHHLSHGGHLPPGLSGGPDGGSICAHHGGAQAADAAVHVAVAVRGHHHGMWVCIALFAHHLVANASACRIEVDAVGLCKGLDGAVLGEILFALVLYIVVQREHNLPRIGKRGRLELLELAHDGRGVVVGHDVGRPHRHKVTGPDNVAGLKVHRMALHNLLDQVLRHSCPRGQAADVPLGHPNNRLGHLGQRCRHTHRQRSSPDHPPFTQPCPHRLMFEVCESMSHVAWQQSP